MARTSTMALTTGSRVREEGGGGSSPLAILARLHGYCCKCVGGSWSAWGLQCLSST